MNHTEQAAAEGLHAAVAAEGVPVPIALTVQQAAAEIAALPDGVPAEVSGATEQFLREHEPAPEPAPLPVYREHPDRPALRQVVENRLADLVRATALEESAKSLRLAGQSAQAAAQYQQAQELRTRADRDIHQANQLHEQMTAIEHAHVAEQGQAYIETTRAQLARQIPGFRDAKVRDRLVEELRANGYSQAELNNLFDPRPVLAAAQRLGLTHRKAPQDVRDRLRRFGRDDVLAQIEQGRLKPGSLDVAAARLQGLGNPTLSEQKRAAAKRASRVAPRPAPGRPSAAQHEAQILARLKRAI